MEADGANDVASPVILKDAGWGDARVPATGTP